MRKSVLVAALLGAAILVSQTQASFIVENRAGGLNYGNFSAPSGWAASAGNVNAPGCTSNIGSMYSGTGSFFGPTRQAIFTFTPTDVLQPGESLLLHVDLAWTSTAGQTDTAVVLYTGVSSGADLDPWGNAGPGDVVARTTMDMYYRAAGVWNAAFDAIPVTPGVTYKVGIYGGHVTTTVTGTPNRVASGAVQFTTSITPEPATLAFIGLGALALLIRRR